MYSFIDGTHLCHFPTTNDGSSNSNYVFWVRESFSLLGVVLAFLSHDIHCFIS